MSSSSAPNHSVRDRKGSKHSAPKHPASVSRYPARKSTSNQPAAQSQLLPEIAGQGAASSPTKKTPKPTKSATSDPGKTPKAPANSSSGTSGGGVPLPRSNKSSSLNLAEDDSIASLERGLAGLSMRPKGYHPPPPTVASDYETYPARSPTSNDSQNRGVSRSVVSMEEGEQNVNEWLDKKRPSTSGSSAKEERYRTHKRGVPEELQPASLRNFSPLRLGDQTSTMSDYQKEKSYQGLEWERPFNNDLPEGTESPIADKLGPDGQLLPPKPTITGLERELVRSRMFDGPAPTTLPPTSPSRVKKTNMRIEIPDDGRRVGLSWDQKMLQELKHHREDMTDALKLAEKFRDRYEDTKGEEGAQPLNATVRAKANLDGAFQLAHDVVARVYQVPDVLRYDDFIAGRRCQAASYMKRLAEDDALGPNRYKTGVDKYADWTELEEFRKFAIEKTKKAFDRCIDEIAERDRVSRGEAMKMFRAGRLE